MPEYNGTTPVISDTDPDVADWLTSDYIQSALRKYKKDNSLKIVNIVFSPATAKGENYASCMTRVRVEYLCKDDTQPQSGSYIVKTTFEGDEFITEKLNQYDVFGREIELYEVIFPKLTSLLRDIDDDDKLFPDTIHVDHAHSALVFEDLSVEKYVLADRIQGLDMTHAKMVLTKLAKMHAASAALNERSRDSLKKFDRGMFNRYTDAFTPFFVNTFEACGKAVKQWNGCQELGEKILNLKPVLMEYGRRVFDAKEDFFNVLIHGDLWINNFMFTYHGNNDPKDVLMIDFQYSCWTSPAVDLHYFFNTSLREEIRLHQQDELVQYYYYTLVDTLRAFKYNGKIPSLHEFWIQFTEKSFYAVTSACIVQPLFLNTENTENADFRALMDDDERARSFKKSLYTIEKVQKNLRRLLPIFDRRGLLDVN